MNTICGRRYQPARGGHAPGHLREALYQWIENGASASFVLVEETEVPAQTFLGLLWNCSDTLPSDVRQDLRRCGIDAGSVASAVRQLRREGYEHMKKSKEPV
jgi:hypothetical protein